MSPRGFSSRRSTFDLVDGVISPVLVVVLAEKTLLSGGAFWFDCPIIYAVSVFVPIPEVVMVRKLQD